MFRLLHAEDDHELIEDSGNNVLDVVLHEAKLFLHAFEVALDALAERERPEAHGVHVVGRAVRGDARDQQPQGAEQDGQDRFLVLLAVRESDEDETLEHLPERVQVHGDLARETEEVRIWFVAEREAVIHAVEIGAKAEVLEGHDLVVERHARHEVVAVHDAEVLVVEVLIAVGFDGVVADAGLTEGV